MQNTFRKNTPNEKSILRIFPSFIFERRFHIVSGFFLQGLSLFFFIAFISHFFFSYEDQTVIESFIRDKSLGFKQLQIHNKLGFLGALCSYYFIFRWMGFCALFLPIILYSAGHKIVYKNNGINLYRALNSFIFITLWLNIFFAYLQNKFNGIHFLEFMPGGIGFVLNTNLKSLVGEGIVIILLVSLLAFLVYVFKWENINNLKVHKIFGSILHFVVNKIRSQKKESKNSNIADDFKEESGVISYDLNIENTDIKKTNIPNLELEIENIDDIGELNDNVDSNIVSDKEEFTTPVLGKYDSTLDLSQYKYPKIDILKLHGLGKHKVCAQELEENKVKIIDTLINFKIGISSIKATIGPTVTLYEIIPEPGIKISKIKNLEDDIALSLAALGIRIIAPIPGKGTIGIEVPNKKREIVSFRSIAESEKFIEAKMDLPIIIGKTISNEVCVADLSQMPHLLIAGATGQGKSVGINAVLGSLLYKKHPSQLKFVLVDPKKVELSLYSKIERHFLAKLPSSEESIITATKEVIHTLNSLCIEMDTRYELLKDAGTRNIKEYNNKFISRKLNPNQGHRFLPYIVLVIDEFADMIMTAGKEIETPVARLAQLARAIGIHLVLATQRPSVNVITGTIKANFPARISYKVSSKIDSRTILDSGGADQLVGKGDMLFSMGSDIIRLQCPFIDTEEVEGICQYIGSQQGYPSAYSLPVYEADVEKADIKNLSERDSMFEEAAKLVVTHQQGSTSLIQRRLKLGYNRAGRLIDQLEAAGVVGPFEGSKARSVLIPDEQSLNHILESLV